MAGLTSKSVETWKHKAVRQEIADDLLPGFYLIVQPTAKKSWAIRYKFAGRTRKLTLGTYPATSLAKAREAARVAMEKIQHGTDPAAEKQQAKSERLSGAYDISAVLDDYVHRHITKSNKPRTVTEFTRVIERELKPRWKGRDIRDLKRRDIVALLDQLADRAPGVAVQAHAIISRFCRFCLERGIIDVSPFTGIPKPRKAIARDRVLTDQEIVALWRGCEMLAYPFGPLIKFLLLTAQRRDEVASAQWNEFDPDQALWTIPAARAKNGNAHTVQLAEPALEILRDLPRIAGRGLVFTTNGMTPVSGWSRAKDRLDGLMARELGRDIVDWRLHDLRRTAASGMAALNVPPHVVEKILNHRSGTIQGVAAVYNRHDYAFDRANALRAWASRIEALTENQISNVISMRGR